MNSGYLCPDATEYQLSSLRFLPFLLLLGQSGDYPTEEKMGQVDKVRVAPHLMPGIIEVSFLLYQSQSLLGIAVSFSLCLLV